jgi:hypothetical protein
MSQIGATTPWGRYVVQRARMGLLRALLRPLVQWAPPADPTQTYSLVLACPARLLTLLGANLLALSRQNRTHLDRIYIVVDAVASPALAARECELMGRYAPLPIEFLHFTSVQARVLDAVGWGWAYAWLSWCVGLAASRSRYVVLHDLDLLTLDADFLERRFAAIQGRGLQYLGMDRFAFNGFNEADNLTASNEMILDAAFVRERFKPIDLFAHVGVYRGRRVCFDLTLHAQSRAGRGGHLGYRVLEMVHPNQMICQFTALCRGRGQRATPKTTLLLLPYYFYLAGDDGAMRQLIASLGASAGAVRLCGQRFDISGVAAAQVRALAEMAYQAERVLRGGVAPPVADYFERLEGFAGGAKAEAA